MIKTLKLKVEEVPGRRPVIDFNLEDTDYDRFDIEQDMMKDGSRFLVMSNDEMIIVGYYTSESSFELNKKYGLDIEPILFEKMRELLGYKRKF